MRVITKSLTCFCVVGMLAMSAKASVIIDFAYLALDGSYNSGTSKFTATGDGDSSAILKRLVTPFGTDAVFASGDIFGDVVFEMDISNISGTTEVGATADGDGTFLFKDADNEEIAGNLNGVWTLSAYTAGSVSVFVFVGSLSDILITGDGTFDGSAGGSFSTDFTGIAVEPYGGYFVNLIVETGVGEWFNEGSFEELDFDSTGKIIPAPGAALLGMLGMSMVASWRRKRAA